jgi:hypothetical protein
MSNHLTEEQVWTSVEDHLKEPALSHLLACAACRERRRDAEEGLSLAGEGGSVPEPSPLYWAAFRRQVERRIGEEPSPSAFAAWRRFFAPGTLVPVGVAAVMVLLVVPLLRQGSAPAPASPALPVWEALPAARDDGSLDVLRGLALAGIDLDTAAGCQEVVECLAALSDEESLALAEVMRVRMPEGRS